MSEDTSYREIRDVSASFASRLIAAAKAKADEIGKPMVIAVVDQAGNLKEFLRMDGAPLLSIEIAENKAYTAAAFGIPTSAWFDMIKDDPPLLHNMLKTPRLVVIGGGLPIELGGIAGAVGVSGGSYEQDVLVAEAGVSALRST